MMCTDCKFRTSDWEIMKFHYKTEHPDVKNPGSYFTKKAKTKLKLIIGYDEQPTEYFLGTKKITKVEFAKEVMRRSNGKKSIDL